MVRVRLGIGHHDFTSMGRPSSWHCARPRRLAERAVVVFVYRGIKPYSCIPMYSQCRTWLRRVRSVSQSHACIPRGVCDRRKFKNKPVTSADLPRSGNRRGAFDSDQGRAPTKGVPNDREISCDGDCVVMPYTVELRRIGADLAASMAEMHTWLDDNRINPTEF